MKKLILAGLLAISLPAFAASRFYVVVPIPAKTTVAGAPNISVGLAGYNLPAGQVGQPYAGFDFRTLLSVTGDPTYTGYGVHWSLASGTLPAGLTLNAEGVLGGTPTAGGTSSFQLKASYRNKAGQQVYQIIVANIEVGLAAGTPPQAIVGQPFGYDLKPLLTVTGDSAYGGDGSGVTWTVVSNTLPAGLYLTSDGWIGGTPTAGGTGSITARATYKGVNGQQTYQVVTLAVTVGLGSATPPQALVGQPYSYDLKPLLSVTGDSAYTDSAVTWSVVSSSLPSGLALTSDGVIGGMPTAAGTGSITARAAYKGVSGQQTYQIVTLAITVSLSAATPPQALVGQTYSYDLKSLLSVTGDPAYTISAVTWSVLSSSLPAGLVLNSAGVISGTPTASGTGSVVARATYRGTNGQQTYQVVSAYVQSAATSPTTSMSFPNTDTGSNSAAQTVTLTNTGLGPLTVSTPTVQGEFSETSNCPSSLASGASCSVSMVFMPRTGGNETGSLTIPTGGGNKVISLSGRGLVYTYVSSGYYASVPVQTQVECDWHNTVSAYESGGNDCPSGPHPTDNWTSTWYNCHGAVMQVDTWSCPCGGCPGTGGETAVEYETVTTYQQQWVDTSYWAWE